jgi:hypothetical protein
MASLHKPGESKPLRRFHPSAFNLGMSRTKPALTGHRLRGWNFYNPRGVEGGSAFGATNEGGSVPWGGGSTSSRRVPGGGKTDCQKLNGRARWSRGCRGWGGGSSRHGTPPPGKFLNNSPVSLSVRCRLAKWRMKRDDRTLPTRVTSPPAMELYSARGGSPWGGPFWSTNEGGSLSNEPPLACGWGGTSRRLC